ncbi:MAG: DUF29 domain-containing protein [Coleofasciculaceae cyanobacterium SM2_1_6]|nr:DUF29 domain-containing protein [Coleofasciculaceae cyanobacterium SM2_1_6]
MIALESQATLYETDYHLWLEQTIEALQASDLSTIDCQNLIEELISLGKTDLRTVNSLIKQIIIHRLKLDYLPDREPRKHWCKEIFNFQDQLADTLTASLQNKIDLAELYFRAKRQLLIDYELELPETCPYSLTDLLSTDFVDNSLIP